MPTTKLSLPPELHQLLELVPQGTLVVDERGHVMGANRAIRRETGYAAEAIAGKTIFEINPHLSLFSWKRYWQRLREQTKWEEDTEFVNAEGTIYPVRTRAGLLSWRDADFCHISVENTLNSNRYRHLLEMVEKVGHLGAWEWDLVTHQILFTGEAFNLFDEDKNDERQTERTAIQALRRRLSRKTVAHIIEQCRQSVAEGAPFETELSFSAAGQTPKRFRLIGVPVITEGSVSKLYGTIQDISSVTTRNEDKYMAEFTLNHTQEMIYWLKPDATIIFSNEAASEKLGYTQMEIRRMNAWDINPNSSREKWREQWKSLQEHGSLAFESIHRQKNGQHIPVTVQLNYIQYEGQEYGCAFVNDLRPTRERDAKIDMAFRTLNQSNDLIFWIEPEGGLRFFNKAAHQRLGYDRDQFAQLNIRELNPGLDEEWLRQTWTGLKKSQFAEMEIEITDQNDRTLPVDVTLMFVNQRDRENICMICRDISARKAREKELHEAFQEINDLKEKLEREKSYLREEVAETHNFNNIISKSPNYQKVLQQVSQVAATEATVLILGETGTGKELLARALHNLSDREDRPLVKVNCAALPEHLIESELFGHEKGAFTGAFERKTGRFELADGGTVFLDEIGELPLELQSKLLRVLQEGEFERVGNPETISVDVRTLAATNRKLEQLVAEGKFREDLYYRLNVFPIFNIPLRERKEDIPLLIQHFMKIYSKKNGKAVEKIPKRPLDQLIRYEFPGNIRELQNMVERAVILSKGKKLNLEAVLPQHNKRDNGISADRRQFLSFEEMQRQHILAALERTHWRVTGRKGAAKLLRMNGKTLASKMRKLGIKREDYVKI